MSVTVAIDVVIRQLVEAKQKKDIASAEEAIKVAKVSLDSVFVALEAKKKELSCKDISEQISDLNEKMRVIFERFSETGSDEDNDEISHLNLEILKLETKKRMMEKDRAEATKAVVLKTSVAKTPAEKPVPFKNAALKAVSEKDRAEAAKVALKVAMDAKKAEADEDEKVSNWRTLPCKRGSNCKFGIKCNFIHTDKEIEAFADIDHSSSAETAEAEKPSNWRTLPCKHGEKCKYGVKCDFLHTEKELKSFKEKTK